MKRFVSLLNTVLVLSLITAGCKPAPTPEAVETVVIELPGAKVVVSEGPIATAVPEEVAETQAKEATVTEKEVPATVEVEIEKEVVVEKEVEKPVEVVVTATPVPLILIEALIWVAILDVRESARMIREGLEQDTISVDETQDWIEMFESDVEQLASWSAENPQTQLLLPKLEYIMTTILVDVLLEIRDQALTYEEAASTLSDIELELASMESDALALLAELGDSARQQATALRDANLAIPSTPQLPPEGEVPPTPSVDENDIEACKRRWSDQQFLESLLLDDMSLDEVLEFVGDIDDFCRSLFEEEVEPTEFEILDMSERVSEPEASTEPLQHLMLALPGGTLLPSLGDVLVTLPSLPSEATLANDCSCTWKVTKTLIPSARKRKGLQKTTTKHITWWDAYDKLGTYTYVRTIVASNCRGYSTDKLEAEGFFVVSLKVECTPENCCVPNTGRIFVFAIHKSSLKAATDVDGCIFRSTEGGAQAHEVANLYIDDSPFQDFSKPKSAAVGERVNSSVTLSFSATGSQPSKAVAFTLGDTKAAGTEEFTHSAMALKLVNKSSTIVTMQTLSYARVSHWRKASASASITPLVTGIGLIGLETNCTQKPIIWYSALCKSLKSEECQSAKELFLAQKKHYLKKDK